MHVKDAATFDGVFSKGPVWDKQVSGGSTVVPETDDFSRFTTEVVNEVHDFDEYEMRGGMAATSSKPLLTAPDHRCGPVAMSIGGQELDFYETRGGLAEKFGTVPALDLDAYEVRGGMASTLSWQLSAVPELQREAPEVRVGDQELDFYETRGGIAEKFSTAANASDFDAYEVRGGMAAKLAWQLKSTLHHSNEVPTTSVGGQELDFFETRGGMVEKFAMAAQIAELDAYEVRGGMATKLGWQLRQALQQPAALSAVSEGGQQLDFYEMRGGMAEKLFAKREVCDFDEYEMRGGMAAKASKQVLVAPSQRCWTPSIHIGGQDLDFYETRGGMAAKFLTEQADSVDGYEARGGMAAKSSQQLLPAPAAPREPLPVCVGGQELDFYETRGGMAEHFGGIAEVCKLDAYEVRGGMAAALSSHLVKAPERHQGSPPAHMSYPELDFYEARGGMAVKFYAEVGTLQEEACKADLYELRGGMAEMMWPQLPDTPDTDMPEHDIDEEVVHVGDRELDLYEMRGGMADFFRRAAKVSGPDAYELRGGMASRYAGQLLPSPPQCGLVPGLAADGHGLDFYEIRGGMAEQLLKQMEATGTDEYEARGSLANQTSPKPPVLQVKPGVASSAEDKDDEYEARGGQGAEPHSLLPSVCQIA